MYMNSIYVRRYHRGHPWIFSNEIINKKDIQPDEDVVDIYRGRQFIGRGFYNPHSLIAVRIFSAEHQEFDKHFVDAMITKAFEYRSTFVTSKTFRLVYSESDGLPGLIIDRYDANYVVQINCLGMDRRRDLAVNSLLRFDPQSIYERSDTSPRVFEGLEQRTGLLYGTLKNPFPVDLDGLNFLVDIEQGQKTGFFLDLNAIRQETRSLSNNRKVLDLFCYTGAFACYAARGGARSVTGVDSSKTAIDLAKENCRLNGLKQITFIDADVFDYLRTDKYTYDLIILDPPSFAKSKKTLAAARRGYRDINTQAMKHLGREGILITTSCSHHLGEEDFRDILTKAATDAGVNLSIIHRATQGLDHPVLLNMPESRYLKCFFLKRIN
ncbi:MAG: class I SAM-dependent rRNA methyltransferase [candidate division WOR-3 bacterium]|nr:MAG: class I SAM-dependent rRNA methyltransferase [candidate division WOR-3 bacterium]